MSELAIVKGSCHHVHVNENMFKALCSKNVRKARLAQSVERQPFKLVVVGSSPTVGIFALYFCLARLFVCDAGRIKKHYFFRKIFFLNVSFV